MSLQKCWEPFINSFNSIKENNVLQHWSHFFICLQLDIVLVLDRVTSLTKIIANNCPVLVVEGHFIRIISKVEQVEEMNSLLLNVVVTPQ